MQVIKNIKILCVLMMMGNLSFSQDYSISAGVLGSFDSVSSLFSSSTFTSRVIFEDFYVETVGEITTSTKFNYTPNLGHYVNLNHYFPLNKSLTIQTGIGISKYSFSFTRSSGSAQLFILSQDTIFESIEPASINSPCDILTNSTNNISVQDEYEVDLLYLNVPLVLAFKVTPKYELKAGAIFKTPIYAETYREFVAVEIEDVGDLTECTFYLSQENNTSGAEFNNIGLDIFLGAAYKPFPYLSIDFSIMNSIQNVYHNDPTNLIGSIPHNLKPLQLGLGLSVYLNRSNSKSKPSKNKKEG